VAQYFALLRPLHYGTTSLIMMFAIEFKEQLKVINNSGCASADDLVTISHFFVSCMIC